MKALTCIRRTARACGLKIKITTTSLGRHITVVSPGNGTDYALGDVFIKDSRRLAAYQNLCRQIAQADVEQGLQARVKQEEGRLIGLTRLFEVGHKLNAESTQTGGSHD